MRADDEEIGARGDLPQHRRSRAHLTASNDASVPSTPTTMRDIYAAATQSGGTTTTGCCAR